MTRKHPLKVETRVRIPLGLLKKHRPSPVRRRRRRPPVEYLSSELWRRTTIYLRRALASAVGMTPSELNTHVRVSFCKVAEFQRRGSVHLHVVVRLDAAGDEIDAPPHAFDATVLAGAFLRAVGGSRSPCVRATSPISGTRRSPIMSGASWRRQAPRGPIRALHAEAPHQGQPARPPGPRAHQVPPLLDHGEGPRCGPGGPADGQSPSPP